jgi:hypothetical protein
MSCRFGSYLALALLGAVGCGATAEHNAEMSFSLPWRSAAGSPCSESTLATNIDGLGVTMKATLSIGGGFNNCPLNVDPSTLAVSGSCPNITVGLVRPLMVSYGLPDPINSAHLAYLAYLFGYVDLRPTTIGDNPSTVAVDMTNGPNTHEVITQGEFDSLKDQSGNKTLAPPCDDNCVNNNACDWLCDSEVLEKDYVPGKNQGGSSGLQCNSTWTDGNLGAACQVPPIIFNATPSCRY